MKKVLSIIALLWGVAQLSSAEDFSYEFVKSDGSIVPNGSLVTITNAEVADDGSGDIVMNSGLGAFRRDGDVDDLLRIAYDIQTMDNGSMQICFPSACKYINSVSASATNPGKMTSQQQSIATEWFPTAYGKCTAKLSLQTVVSVIGGYEVIDEGPTITLQFVYADPATRISSASTSVATPVAYYSLSGQRLSSRPRGMALVRLSDGRVVKRCLK